MNLSSSACSSPRRDSRCLSLHLQRQPSPAHSCSLSQSSGWAGKMIAARISQNNQSSVMENKRHLSTEQREELAQILKARFEQNSNRHNGMEWPNVQAKLEAKPEKLWPLHEMETTGGEPDVVGYDEKTGEYIFYDCSAESPRGRFREAEGMEGCCIALSLNNCNYSASW